MKILVADPTIHHSTFFLTSIIPFFVFALALIKTIAVFQRQLGCIGDQIALTRDFPHGIEFAG